MFLRQRLPQIRCAHALDPAQHEVAAARIWLQKRDFRQFGFQPRPLRDESLHVGLQIRQILQRGARRRVRRHVEVIRLFDLPQVRDDFARENAVTHAQPGQARPFAERPQHDQVRRVGHARARRSPSRRTRYTPRPARRPAAASSRRSSVSGGIEAAVRVIGRAHETAASRRFRARRASIASTSSEKSARRSTLTTRAKASGASNAYMLKVGGVLMIVSPGSTNNCKISSISSSAPAPTRM